MNDAHNDPRDPKLSRLYRKASQGEPPPALDAAILAAARAATAPQRPPRPWWRRLQAPLALAATVVLAVVLTLSMDRNPPPDAEIPARAAPGESAPAPATERAPPTRSNAVETRSPEAPASTEALRPPPAPAKPKPAARAPEGAPSAAPAAAAGRPAASADKALPAPVADSERADRRGDVPGQSVAAPAPEAKREAAAPLPPRKPEAWIAEIRDLRRQGRPAEAERSLREFRAAYPDYPLPEDLR